MDDKIMVSVICNTYNHDKYIRKTLEGFINQKVNFRYEVLVHDDASTDSTADIIREYEERYPNVIKPIYQTENMHSKKVPFPYIYQYPRAKGKYIAWCEGDDFWIDSLKLQKQVDFLETHNEYSSCVHKYIVVDEEDREIDVKTFGYYENEGCYSIKNYQTEELPSQLASLVARNLFNTEGKGYPKSFNMIKEVQGDIKLFLYLLMHGNVYRMKDVMSAYRFVVKKDGESWSSRSIKKPYGFKMWRGIKKLEKACYKEYGVKINLENRKLKSAIQAVLDIKKECNFKTIAQAVIVVLMQRGAFFAVAKGKKRGVKNR